MIREVQIANEFINGILAKMMMDGIGVEALKTLTLYSDDAKLYPKGKCGFYGIVLIDNDNPIGMAIDWDAQEDILPTNYIIGYIMVCVKEFMPVEQLS